MRQLYRPIESSMKFDSPLCQTTKRYELLSIFPFYPSIDNRWKTNYFAFSSLEGSSGKLEGRGERRKRRKTCLFLDSLLISTKRIRGIGRGGGRHAEFFESSSEDGGIVSKACTWEWWPSLPMKGRSLFQRPWRSSSSASASLEPSHSSARPVLFSRPWIDARHT